MFSYVGIFKFANYHLFYVLYIFENLYHSFQMFIIDNHHVKENVIFVCFIELKEIYLRTMKCGMKLSENKI